MPLRQTVASTEEPLTLDEAKAHLRVDFTSEDSYISALIAAARGWIEKECALALITQEWALTLDAFPSGTAPIELKIAPLISVDSIKYTPLGEGEKTWAAANYAVDIYGRPARIVPVSAWPADQLVALNGVTVAMTCGFGAAAAVPDVIKEALRLLVGYWYLNREDSRLPERVRTAVFALLAKQRPIGVA